MKKANRYDTLFRDFSMLDVSRILYKEGKEFAEKMDKNDPLSQYRMAFHFPKNEKGDDLIYLCGNSLGLQSEAAFQSVQQGLDQWKNLGVKGHFSGERPWVPFHLELKEKMGMLVGGKASEVTLMNTLTTNLHFMLASFYTPSGKRTKILVEPDIFPSDRYAIESQIEWHGLSVEENLLFLPKREGYELIKEEDIEKTINEQGENIDLILLGGVNYYTGQLFDIEKITELGHEQGCKVGFDLAHAVGNVPLQLHNAEVDFAVWCTYKYMNAGPGSIAGVFVHEKHHNNHEIPKLKGWWGHNAEIRFGMRDNFDPMPGAESWQLSCQPILSLAPIKATLEHFHDAGMHALRNKSILLTGYLEYLINHLRNERIQIITPHLQRQRGCQLSIKILEGNKAIYQKLVNNGIVVDWREPNVIRVAPVPLYNSYLDVYNFVDRLKKLI